MATARIIWVALTNWRNPVLSVVFLLAVSVSPNQQIQPKVPCGRQEGSLCRVSGGSGQKQMREQTVRLASSSYRKASPQGACKGAGKLRPYRDAGVGWGGGHLHAYFVQDVRLCQAGQTECFNRVGRQPFQSSPTSLVLAIWLIDAVERQSGNK